MPDTRLERRSYMAYPIRLLQDVDTEPLIYENEPELVNA